MAALPRLRQVALAAHDLDRTTAALQAAFAWPDPFHDPGVAEFGLRNAVFAAGDTFVEVVSPAREGTTAGRYLHARGGDSGYMAIFQVDDVAGARARVADAGVRVVWQLDLPDMSGTHLHPKDTPGAIVSLDWADPPGAWRWAGPVWTGPEGGTAARGTAQGAIVGLTVEVAEPVTTANVWAAVLGQRAVPDGDGAVVELAAAEQTLRFVPAGGARGEGISAVALSDGATPPVDICGVRFASVSDR